jgi:hypothetical protein
VGEDPTSPILQEDTEEEPHLCTGRVEYQNTGVEHLVLKMILLLAVRHCTTQEKMVAGTVTETAAVK